MGILSEQAIISLTIALAHFALLGYLLIKKKEQVSSPNWLLGYLALAALWNLLFFLQTNDFIARSFGLTWNLVLLYPLVLIAVVIWCFTHTFLETKIRKGWFVLGGGVTLGLMGIIDFGFISIPATPLPINNSVLDNQIVTQWLGGGAVVLYLGLAIQSGLKAQQQTYSPRHRNRIQILLLGLGLLIVGIGSYLSLIPIVQAIGLVIQWLGAPILIYIVLTQNLPDINRGLREFVSFLVITIGTLAFYSLIVYALQTLLAGIQNAEIIIAALAAILLATFYLPLRQLTQNLVERILFRHRYNYERVIKDYIQAINNILFIKDLVTISLAFIEKNLKINGGAFFLLNTQDDRHYHFSILSSLNSGLPKSVKLKKSTPLTEQLIDHGQ